MGPGAVSFKFGSFVQHTIYQFRRQFTPYDAEPFVVNSDYKSMRDKRKNKKKNKKKQIDRE